MPSIILRKQMFLKMKEILDTVHSVQLLHYTDNKTDDQRNKIICLNSVSCLSEISAVFPKMPYCPYIMRIGFIFHENKGRLE